MAYIRCEGAGTPTITRIAKVDAATAGSSSQPGEVYSAALNPNKQYIVVATGTTNCGNGDGYIAIGSSSTRAYIPTHSTSQSSTNGTISSVITGVSSISVLLGWAGSHTGVWFKYSVTIYQVA